MSALPHEITKRDLESKFRELQGEVESAGESAKSYALDGRSGRRGRGRRRRVFPRPPARQEAIDGRRGPPSLIGRLVGVLRGRGLRQGVLGGNRRWLAIWAVIFTAQTVHKVMKPKPVVERFTLKPGETLMITDFGEPATPS